MHTTVISKKTFSDTEVALSDVSRLLSRLASSRKAGMRLKEITELTGVVARLSRSLQGHGSDHSEDDGLGDKNHFAKISEGGKVRNLIR
jgi:hypothetical protein